MQRLQREPSVLRDTDVSFLRGWRSRLLLRKGDIFHLVAHTAQSRRSVLTGRRKSGQLIYQNTRMTHRPAIGITVATLAIVLVLLAASFAYYYVATETQVSSLSGQVSTLNSQISTLGAEVSSLRSSHPAFANITVVNGSVPLSAWQLQSPSNLVERIQCGGTRPSGSGFVTLSNTGNGPTTVQDVVVFITPGNEYVAEENFSSLCTINPSSSVTVYFNFSYTGPRPTEGDSYYLEAALGNGYSVGFLGILN